MGTSAAAGMPALTGPSMMQLLDVAGGDPDGHGLDAFPLAGQDQPLR